MKTNFYFHIVMLSAFLTLLMPGISYSQIPYQGPYHGSAYNEEFGACLSCPGASWSNHQNAMLPDNMFANCQLNAYPNCFMSGCYYSRALQSTDFGFSLPGAAIIQGIKAEVLRNASNAGTVYDSLVMLMRGGFRTGGSRAQIISFPTVASYLTYGDSTDLWDTVWTAADINNPSFGFYFKPLNKNPNVVTAGVDHIQLTVYYLDATGIPSQQTSGNYLIYDIQQNRILISSQVRGSGKFSLFDSKGSIAFEKKVEMSGSEIMVPLPALNNGIYVAVLSAGSSQSVLKFSAR